MEKKINKKLMDKKIQMFKRLNINRSMSVTLMCLSETGEAPSKTIEELTGLKQPEVSNAVKGLEEKGWVTSNKMKNPDAGRPVKYYKMTKPLNEIINSLEQKEIKKVNETNEVISRLREVIDENERKM